MEAMYQSIQTDTELLNSKQKENASKYTEMNALKSQHLKIEVDHELLKSNIEGMATIMSCLTENAGMILKVL